MYKTTRYRNPEYHNQNLHWRENLQYDIILFLIFFLSQLGQPTQQ